MKNEVKRVFKMTFKFLAVKTEQVKLWNWGSQQKIIEGIIVESVDYQMYLRHSSIDLEKIAPQYIQVSVQCPGLYIQMKLWMVIQIMAADKTEWGNTVQEEKRA